MVSISVATLGLAALLAGGGAALATVHGWGSGEVVPGSGKLNAGGNAQIQSASISCPRQNQCGAGGLLVDKAGNVQTYVVSKS